MVDERRRSHCGPDAARDIGATAIAFDQCCSTLRSATRRCLGPGELNIKCALYTSDDVRGINVTEGTELEDIRDAEARAKFQSGASV
jgi:hypothetical protein